MVERQGEGLSFAYWLLGGSRHGIRDGYFGIGLGSILLAAKVCRRVGVEFCCWKRNAVLQLCSMESQGVVLAGIKSLLKTLFILSISKFYICPN